MGEASPANASRQRTSGSAGSPPTSKRLRKRSRRERRGDYAGGGEGVDRFGIKIDFVLGKQGNDWLIRVDKPCILSPMGETCLRYRQTNNDLSVKTGGQPPARRMAPGVRGSNHATGMICRAPPVVPHPHKQKDRAFARSFNSTETATVPVHPWSPAV